MKFRQGDIILIQGKWKNISRIADVADGIVVMGQPLEEASRVTLDYKAPLAAAIMLLMIMTMVFDFIPVAPVTAVMMAGLLMVITGCIRSVEAAYKTINWESIVLIAAMLPMSAPERAPKQPKASPPSSLLLTPVRLYPYKQVQGF